MSEENQEHNKLPPLSADAFIQALTGETVQDENGKQCSYLVDTNNGKAVVIKHISVTEEIRIEENHRFPFSIFIDGGEFQDDFRINGGEFQKDFKIYGGEFQKDFWIIEGEFQKNFWIEGGEFQKDFRIEGGEFQKDFVISEGEFQKDFRINGGEFQNDFGIFGGRFRSLYFSLLICFNVHIESATISEIGFDKGISESGSLSLFQCKFMGVAFRNFTNKGEVAFMDVQCNGDEGSFFAIENCDMGNVTFFNTDFESFAEILIKDSRLIEMKTTNKHLPDSKAKVKIYTGENKAQNPQYLEELYNQLYLAMQKSGNRTQEIKYYRDYLEWHRKNILIMLKEANLFNSAIKGDWYTPVSLWLHKKTTLYGANWIRSIILIIVLGAIFYLLFAISLPEIEIGWKHLSWGNLGYHFRYYVDFIIPTHKMDFIPNTHPGGISALLDILGRITISFLIYQTIAAFRRFGRP